MQSRWVKRALLVAATCVVGAAALATWADGPGDEGRFGFNNQESEIIRGLRISPVKLNLTGRNIALVGRGSYLVNAVAGCADCHTCPTYAPGHNPYAGGDGQINAENYLAGGTPFGPFTSANITPDASGRPAGLTFEGFLNVIRTGENHSLFVMPWPIYRNMTTHDLRAIYAYLSSIPHAEPGTCAGAGS